MLVRSRIIEIGTSKRNAWNIGPMWLKIALKHYLKDNLVNKLEIKIGTDREALLSFLMVNAFITDKLLVVYLKY